MGQTVAVGGIYVPSTSGFIVPHTEAPHFSPAACETDAPPPSSFGAVHLEPPITHTPPILLLGEGAGGEGYFRMVVAVIISFFVTVTVFASSIRSLKLFLHPSPKSLLHPHFPNLLALLQKSGNLTCSYRGKRRTILTVDILPCFQLIDS